MRVKLAALATAVLFIGYIDFCLNISAIAQTIIVDGPPSTQRAVRPANLADALDRIAVLEAQLDTFETWRGLTMHRIAFLEENHGFRLEQVEQLSGTRAAVSNSAPIQTPKGQETRLSVRTVAPVAPRLVKVTIRQGAKVVKGPMDCLLGMDGTFALAFDTSDLSVGRYDIVFDDPKIPTQAYTVLAAK